MPDPQTDSSPDKRHDAEQPLSDTLLGDDGAGGLAGQGGIVDIDDEIENDNAED